MTLSDPTAHSDDAALLDDLRRVATTIQSDPVFAERLRATLYSGAARRAVAAPPTVWQPTLTTASPRPLLGPSRTQRPRRTGHLATIAAILAIVLVGYGALSLSGRSPSGLRLSFSDQPQASAQGVTTGVDPVVGTWSFTGNAGNGNTMLDAPTTLITFDAGGGVVWTTIGGTVGHGTWSTRNGVTSATITTLITYPDYPNLDRQMAGRDNSTAENGQGAFVPALFEWTLVFTIVEDGSRTENLEGNYRDVVRPSTVESGTNDPDLFVIDYSEDYLGYPSPVSALSLYRLTDVLDRAPTIAASDPRLGGGQVTTVQSSQEASPAALPTPTPMPNAAAVGLTPTLAPNPSPST